MLNLRSRLARLKALIPEPEYSGPATLAMVADDPDGPWFGAWMEQGGPAQSAVAAAYLRWARVAGALYPVKAQWPEKGSTLTELPPDHPFHVRATEAIRRTARSILDGRQAEVEQQMDAEYDAELRAAGMPTGPIPFGDRTEG